MSGSGRKSHRSVEDLWSWNNHNTAARANGSVTKLQCQAWEANLVLYSGLDGRGLGSEHDVEVCPLLQCIEPNPWAHENDSNGVYDKRPVEDYEADSDMIRLNDGADREGPGSK